VSRVILGLENLSWATIGRNPDDKPAASHEYRWLPEAQDSERKTAFKPSNSETANDWRYAGHCYFQAAFQASHQDEFSNLMFRAANALERAAKAVDSTSGDNSPILEQRYTGLAKYCNAQTAIDSNKALAQLHEAYKTFSTSWTLNPAKAVDIAPTLPLEMIIVSNDIMNYDPNILNRLPILEQSLKATDPSQPFYANLNKDQQQILATERIDALQFAWTHLSEYSDRESAGNIAIEQFEGLRHHIKEAADPRIPASAFVGPDRILASAPHYPAYHKP
jgi:hypothetical protein